jgi:glutathione S-transferase
VSWLVEKCEALQAERDRLVEALEQYVWACEERDTVIDLALAALDRAEITTALEQLQSIDTEEEDLPDTKEWGID